jgi:hypothetical protein
VEAPANRQLQRRAGVELDQAADGLHDAVLGGEDVLHEGVHGGEVAVARVARP